MNKKFKRGFILGVALVFVAVIVMAARYEVLTVTDFFVKNIKRLSENHQLTIGASTYDTDIWSPVLKGTVDFDSDSPSVENIIENKKLAIWSSGGTRYGSGGAASVPDKWEFCTQGSTTGATKYGFADSTLIATGATAYGVYGYAAYVQEMGTIEGQVCELAYNAGVSNQSTWYQRFRGKQIQVGAYVYTDAGTSGATDLIRPYIVTCTNARTTAGVSSFATYSSDYAGGGWELISATTTVPNAATAFEWGFEIKARNALTGASAFILAPFILSGATVNASPIPSANEIIWMTRQLDVWPSGGSTFGAKATAVAAVALDLSADTGWNGIIPDDAGAVYATVGTDATAMSALHFYGDNALGGVTVMAVGNSLPYWEHTWIPVSATGTINVDNIAAHSGVSLAIHGVQMK